ncbi:alpha/beta hydrolase family protein, partial [Trifolium medium]|nr:alpha/beta hydrolase family protein [Trifolium medium]
EEKCDDFSSSSSTMLSFELSNGRLYDPRVPTTLDDDDQYVEYQLDDLTGIPSSAEEEQKMLMEAVKESLKHRELQNPQVKQPPAESSDKDEPRASSHEISKPMETESSLVKHSMNSTAKTTFAASDACEPLKAESNSIALKMFIRD